MPDHILPYKESSLDKKNQVARMFDNIAWRYDFLNRLFSFGLDQYWRKKTIHILKDLHPMLILDIATGTADLAFEALRLNPEKVFGIDISKDMLAIGRKKIKKRNLTAKIELFEGDSEKLIFDDNKFDAITVAFGVRNFSNLEKGLSEMQRVLKPGGKIAVLEFSRPSSSFIRKIHGFYSGKIIPWMGKKISKDDAAYLYLHDSVSAFPSGKQFSAILEQVGFKEPAIQPLTFGVVSIYSAVK